MSTQAIRTPGVQTFLAKRISVLAAVICGVGFAGIGATPLWADDGSGPLPDSHRLGIADWLVIAAFGVGMLWIGWYYSRRTETTEDYLLGGRKMRWLTVGISLFASLLSTLSYLAIPGEMILYGPMYFCYALGYPLVAFVGGWLIIPRIM
jgi:hypothetical protein